MSGTDTTYVQGYRRNELLTNVHLDCKGTLLGRDGEALRIDDLVAPEHVAALERQERRLHHDGCHISWLIVLLVSDQEYGLLVDLRSTSGLAQATSDPEVELGLIDAALLVGHLQQDIVAATAEWRESERVELDRLVAREHLHLTIGDGLSVPLALAILVVGARERDGDLAASDGLAINVGHDDRERQRTFGLDQRGRVLGTDVDARRVHDEARRRDLALSVNVGDGGLGLDGDRRRRCVDTGRNDGEAVLARRIGGRRELLGDRGVSGARATAPRVVPRRVLAEAVIQPARWRVRAARGRDRPSDLGVLDRTTGKVLRRDLDHGRRAVGHMHRALGVCRYRVFRSAELLNVKEMRMGQVFGAERYARRAEVDVVRDRERHMERTPRSAGLRRTLVEHLAASVRDRVGDTEIATARQLDLVEGLVAEALHSQPALDVHLLLGLVHLAVVHRVVERLAVLVERLALHQVRGQNHRVIAEANHVLGRCSQDPDRAVLVARRVGSGDDGTCDRRTGLERIDDQLGF